MARRQAQVRALVRGCMFTPCGWRGSMRPRNGARKARLRARVAAAKAVLLARGEGRLQRGWGGFGPDGGSPVTADEGQAASCRPGVQGEGYEEVAAAGHPISEQDG